MDFGHVAFALVLLQRVSSALVHDAGGRPPDSHDARCAERAFDAAPQCRRDCRGTQPEQSALRGRLPHGAALQGTGQYGITLEEANAIVDEGTNIHGLNENALRDVKEAVWESRKADLELEQAQTDLQKQTEENDAALEHLYNQYDELVDSLEDFADGSQHTEQEFEDQKQKIRETRDEIKRLGGETEHLKDYESTAYRFGQCVAEGASRGIEQNKWRYINSVTSMALAGNSAFQSANQIHSPSRVYKAFGKFIGEGAIEGVESMVRPFAKTMANFAAIGTDAIDEVSSDFNKLSASSEFERQMENIFENKSQTRITVNIGEDKIIDKIVEGINDRNFLQNGNVLSY